LFLLGGCFTPFVVKRGVELIRKQSSIHRQQPHTQHSNREVRGIITQQTVVVHSEQHISTILLLLSRESTSLLLLLLLCDCCLRRHSLILVNNQTTNQTNNQNKSKQDNHCLYSSIKNPKKTIIQS